MSSTSWPLPGTVITPWAVDHPVHNLFPGLPRQKRERRSCGLDPL
ncbi:hypothetical protein SSAG_00063 [Streptomyces sp. Mg1]|nr:hypothetical protein SSAG_00063 [Streptomyces sp. Mg1]